MDRGRPLAALLILGSLAAADAPPPVPEAQWLAPATRLEMLTTRPEACVADDTPDPVAEVYGRVAFNDPLLLGGQAARAGLSCASCHRGGRGNPGFRFPGLSGVPGTADVTTSLMSSHRGDGVFNPKPIPDLTFDTPKVSRTAAGTLEAFIRGLITEEFDGALPPPAVLRGLAAYIRALDPKACNAGAGESFALANSLADYFVALGAAEAALADRDRPTALAMLRGARSTLGTIDRRYARTGLDEARQSLSEADGALSAIQQSLRDGGSFDDAETAVHARWRAVRVWAKPLYAAEARSLYNPALMRVALGGSLPAPREAALRPSRVKATRVSASIGGF